MSGLLVTGTDTSVGKTVVAGLLAAGGVNQGKKVSVFKPVVTGLNEEDEQPADHEFLQAAANFPQSLDEISPYRFSRAASPHLAAKLEGVKIEPALIVEKARAMQESADLFICEGIGGLLVPLTESYSILDLAIDLKLPLIVATRPGLGTINHTLLTLEAADAAGVKVRAVAMTPWPEDPGDIERSNLETVERIGGVQVVRIPRLPESVVKEPTSTKLKQWACATELTALLQY